MTEQMTPLRRRMLDDMTIRNMSSSTQKIYVRAVANFSIYHGRSPDKLTANSTYVAYLFKAISGFSKFGSYTGNGNADGPFIYTGFKPRFLMYKDITNTDSWIIVDSARDTYNPTKTYLLPNANNADGSSVIADILSNGFKLRRNNNSGNAANAVFIYAAFADVPFYYSAQPAASVVSNSNAGTTLLMGMEF